MSNIEYQKIELHSTNNLGKDHERIEYERETTQRLMMENQIQFAIEIDEVDIKNSSNNKTGTAYVLNLIVRKDDVQKVIELLDKEGGFGYYVDLDETFDPMAEEKEEEEQEGAFIEIPEELREETLDSEENVDPIKTFGEIDESDSKKTVVEDLNRTFKFFMNGILIVSYTIAIVTELIFMSAFEKIGDPEGITSMFVAIVIETPIALWFFKIINKKKGE